MSGSFEVVIVIFSQSFFFVSQVLPIYLFSLGSLVEKFRQDVYARYLEGSSMHHLQVTGLSHILMYASRETDSSLHL
jgi:hypothetical protein